MSKLEKGELNTPKGEETNSEIDEVSKQLKQMAQEMGKPEVDLNAENMEKSIDLEIDRRNFPKIEIENLRKARNRYYEKLKSEMAEESVDFIKKALDYEGLVLAPGSRKILEDELKRREQENQEETPEQKKSSEELQQREEYSPTYKFNEKSYEDALNEDIEMLKAIPAFKNMTDSEIMRIRDEQLNALRLAMAKESTSFLRRATEVKRLGLLFPGSERVLDQELNRRRHPVTSAK